MKSTHKIIGIIIIVAMTIGFGFAFISCEETCSSCGGTGLCSTCDGKGAVRQSNGISKTCSSCWGDGKCRDCLGTGRQ